MGTGFLSQDVKWLAVRLMHGLHLVPSYTVTHHMYLNGVYRDNFTFTFTEIDDTADKLEFSFATIVSEQLKRVACSCNGVAGASMSWNALSAVPVEMVTPYFS
jgi:hypothetical protein